MQKGKPLQAELGLDGGQGTSTEARHYAHTAIINGVRERVERWRILSDLAGVAEDGAEYEQLDLFSDLLSRRQRPLQGP